MIENNPRALECIRENLARTKLEGRAMVMGCDVITGLKRLEGKNYRFDIVFMDPPYHHEYERLGGLPEPLPHGYGGYPDCN